FCVPVGLLDMILYGVIEVPRWRKQRANKVSTDCNRLTTSSHTRVYLRRWPLDQRSTLKKGDRRRKGRRRHFPQRMFLEFLLPKREPLIRLNFYWFTKPATRLPEALWLSFRPIATSQQGWTLDKCGEEISPFDVVPSGNPQMHAVERGFRYREQQHEFSVELLDVPLIAFGEMSPLSFSRSQPDPSAGIHCSLFNNAWGTNYVQWFSEDMRCRFVIRAS